MHYRNVVAPTGDTKNATTTDTAGSLLFPLAAATVAAAAAAVAATTTTTTTNQMLHAILRMGRVGIRSQGIVLLRRTLLWNRIAVLLSHGVPIETNAMVRGMYMR